MPNPNWQIPIERTTLPNGLRVLLAPDRSLPVASIYLLFGVGARSESPGRSGFAHLFEHMMFQGSANAPKGVHFQLIESNGGTLNGSTHPDYTDYFEILPSNKLAVGLWLEADRMRSLAITEENFNNQRDAVKEERRLSFDNQPYNTAIIEHWPALAYRNWQNSHSIIGSFEDLDAASADDATRFFRSFYAPNNAILSIAGDVAAPAVMRLIEDYFGDIPPQPQPPRPSLAEPPLDSVRRGQLLDPLAQVPAVMLGYPAPPRRSAVYYALTMLDLVLTGGESSRIHQSLVKGAQSVIQYEAGLGWPFAGFSDCLEPCYFAMFALHSPENSGAEVAGQIQQEIDRVADSGVSEREWRRAQAFLRSHRSSMLQSSLSRARLLAQYEYFDGRPAFLWEEMEQYFSVSPEEVRQAAGSLCRQDRRCELEILTRAAEAEAGAGEEDQA